jgi:MFS family permease
MAAYPDPPHASPAVLQHDPGQRPDHGDGAAARRPGRLGFAPWQYGLAFGAPCVGGLVGARLAPRLVARFGQRKVMFTAGVLRACWSLGLAFIRPGATGIVLVIAVQLGLVTCMGVFNPVLATYRLEQTDTDRVARTLSA